jgi:transposase InsO family protein
LSRPAIVEPVDPFERGELDGLNAAPRAAGANDLGLEQPDHRFGERVVVRIADAADRTLDPGRRQALGVADRQYTSFAFGRRCELMGVRPSMGSVGDAYDNAMCESFFATLECELLDRHRFPTQAAARLAVFEYIEGWYNPHHRHSALDYRSPVNYERSLSLS